MSHTFDATHIVTKIFLAILETQQKYGAEIISKIITGKEIKKLENVNYTTFALWDSEHMFTTIQVKAIIYELISQGYLERHKEYKSLQLTEKGSKHFLDRQKIHFEKSILEEELFSENLNESHESTQILLESGMAPEDIAEKRGLSIQTIYNHISTLIFHKKIKDIRPYITKEKEKLIKPVIKGYKNTPLKMLKESLPENISYGDIKIMLAKQLQTV